MPTLSICLPTYNKYGVLHDENYNNITMLLDLFKSLKKQTYKDYELVISDHSIDGSVKSVCDEWKDELNIKYYLFEVKYGSVEANLNNAMNKAVGKYIKPIFQDDYFSDDIFALEKMVKAMDDGAGWVASSCVHIKENIHDSFYNFHKPIWPPSDDLLLSGQNTIGNPSVIMHKNDGILYDEYLIWLTDVEFYYRLMKKYGKPKLIEETLIVIRYRANGISNTMITSGINRDETRYCLDKKNNTMSDIKEYPAIYERIVDSKII